ncbi:5636_t:CDS:2 [Acaulospora colombiana]|uniref:5636_t:CDS:1 n=1 Tax=Acaulospora colombiana TaxID=27376 RepID=A0ACA9L8R9_9GLOM|nr:5636_t:CDS:2 [Acaulospora colombiana]
MSSLDTKGTESLGNPGHGEASVDGERARLLQMISSIHGPLDNEDSRSSLLIQEYNQLMEMRSRQKKRLDPYKFFPPEIWTLILEYVVGDDSKNAFDLCLVSTEWCQFITSIPCLWTYIQFTFDADLDALETMLHLSSQTSLSVVLEIPLVGSKMKELVFQARDAMKDLHVRSASYVTVWEDLAELLQILRILPNLETMTMEMVAYDVSQLLLGDIMEALPNLRGIHRYGGPAIFECQGYLDMPKLSNLRSVGLQLDRHNDILSILQQSEMLGRLTLCSDNENSSEEESFDIDIFPQMRLEHLELRLKGRLANAVPGLITAAYSTLVSLEVRIEDSSMVLLVENQIDVPNLLFLSLYWVMDRDTPNTARVLPPKFPSLRRLNFDYNFTYQLDETARPLLFFQWARGAMQKVHTIDIDSPWETSLLASDVLEFLGNCPRLTHLTVGVPIEVGRYDTKRYFQNLESLNLGDSELLPFIKSPDLLELSIMFPEPEVLWPSDSKSPFDIGKDSLEIYNFPNLESVSAYTLSLAHSSLFLSFKCLKKIFLTSEQVMEGIWDIPIDRLLSTLIVFPDSCPNLESISSYDPPNWELLFMTFKVRNIWTPSVSPIRYLQLLNYPAEWLLQPLKSLLRLQIPTSPSKDSLFALTLGTRYFDPNIPGCHRCHLTGFDCNYGLCIRPQNQDENGTQSRTDDIHPDFSVDKDSTLTLQIRHEISQIRLIIGIPSGMLGCGAGSTRGTPGARHTIGGRDVPGRGCVTLPRFHFTHFQAPLSPVYGGNILSILVATTAF